MRLIHLCLASCFALTAGPTWAAPIASSAAAPPAQPAPKPAGKTPATQPPTQAAAAPAVANNLPRSGVRSSAELCAQMVRRLPNVSRPLCDRAELQTGPGASVRGTPIFQRDVVAPQARLKVLVVGGIHGDEPSSSSLVLHWIDQALLTPSNIHWRFVPLMNPDGMLKDKPTRTNARGVDLNRNFPTPNWDKEAPQYWAKRTSSDPRRFPGPTALSEPESQWLHEEMARWKPDLIVAVHAPYGVLDFDGPHVPPQRLGRLYLDQVGIFPGSLGNYGGVHKKLPVVTIELTSALRTPQAAEMRQMWLDLLRWTADRLGAD